MHSKNTCTKIVIFAVCVFIYCEYLIYYIVLNDCDWPILDPNTEDVEEINSQLRSNKVEASVKILVLTDTHLLGVRNGHWFDKLRREWQMFRAFQTATSIHQPEIVFVLGDLLDEGSFSAHKDFEVYVQRFYSIFSVPERIKMFVAVGNHDIGFHYSIRPDLNARFMAAFNTSAVQLVTVRGIHFVIVNSMALEGDGCSLCKSAELQLKRISKNLNCAKNANKNRQCKIDKESVQIKTYSRPILMQHYPLYRLSDVECNDSDSAPPIKKTQKFRPKWECLSEEATNQLLTELNPRLSLSGHTHFGCTRRLPYGKDGLEITISSFSWRNTNAPTYGLGVITETNFAFKKCHMPKESFVINVYCISAAVLVVYAIFLTCWTSKHNYYLQQKLTFSNKRRFM